MASRFLTLSMFVVLLSFFIVLNSMSTFEERKSQVVANSVAEAFTRRTTTLDESDPDRSKKSDEAMMVGTTLDKIEGLFTEQISGLKVSQNRLGTIMQMEMTVKKFERLLSDVSSAQIGGRQENRFIKTLVTLMDTQDQTAYRMDIILETEKDPAQSYHQSPAGMGSLLLRVSGYADQIEEFGLPPKLVTSGVKRGKENMVILVFRRYEPLNLLAKTDVQLSPQPPTESGGGNNGQ